MLKDKKILLLVPNAIAGGFLLGLVLSTVPVLIKTKFGLQWVGIITSVWHLTLAVFSRPSRLFRKFCRLGFKH